jgi:hypothetical protein
MHRAILLLLMIALAGSKALGHGFDLHVVLTPDGPKIQGVNNGNPSGEDRLFIEYWLDSPPDDYRLQHGGVIKSSGFAGETTLSLRFLGALWYSNGGPAEIVGGSESVAGLSFDDSFNEIGNVTISGLTPGGSTMSVTGLDDHSTFWSLTPFPVAAGSYGFAYQVIGHQQNGPVLEEFVPSDPLVVVLSTPGFSSGSGGTVEQSRQEIYDAIIAAVPEPSTWLLAVSGLASLGGIALRRCPRSRIGSLMPGCEPSPASRGRDRRCRRP